MTTDRLAEDVPARANGPAAREPAQLRLPAAKLQLLVQFALRTELGSAWWNGFATAHGEPSWLAPGGWRLVAPDVVLLPTGEEG
jgi:hypothetical protein